jgi:molecular chaperone DnaJ
MAANLYEKDLYAVLGVKKGDSADAIKKQYRKLARELHPDKTKGDKKLEDRFKEVSEAYEVLSDDKKRSEYDQMRDAFTSGRIPNGANFGGNPFGGSTFTSGDFSDIFGGGGDVFSTLFGGGAPRGPRRGADLQTEATISFRDSLFGKEITLRSPKGEPTTKSIPAGIYDGAKLRFRGMGENGPAGPGDLYMTIHVAKHPVFSRKENNLHMSLPVTFTEAALGADVKVPTIDGEEVTLRIAPGTPSGRTLRVKGRGVKTSKGTGDLMVTIDVQVPQRVDGRAKVALEQFAEATKEFDPRADLAQRARA